MIDPIGAQLIVFDLDGTLAESKSPIDEDTAYLLCKLLSKKLVAIISGGKFEQFETQLIANLECIDSFSRLHIFPTSGTAYYRFTGEIWEKVYGEDLTEGEKNRIYSAMKEAVTVSGVQFPKETYGPQFEDRITQVSFSALGQAAPNEAKKVWDPDHKKRERILNELKGLEDFDVKIGGSTTIDITKKGIDKAYGIQKMVEYLNIEIQDMFFIGDAIFPGGNDYAPVRLGIPYETVNTPEDTKQIIQKILNESGI